MSPNETLENKAFTQFVPSDWQATKAYKIHLVITKDDEGTYSAVAINLPGVGSCGKSGEAAVENAKEAARETIASYQDDGEEIPWVDTWEVKIPAGAEQKTVVVYV